MLHKNSRNQVEEMQKGGEQGRSEERAYRLAMRRSHLKGARHDELCILSP